MLLIIGLVISLGASILRSGFAVQGQAAEYLVFKTNLQAAHQRFLADVHRSAIVSVDSETEYSFLSRGQDVERPPSPKTKKAIPPASVLKMDVQGKAIIYRAYEKSIQRLIIENQEIVGREIWRLAGSPVIAMRVVEDSYVECELKFPNDPDSDVLWLAKYNPSADEPASSEEGEVN